MNLILLEDETDIMSAHEMEAQCSLKTFISINLGKMNARSLVDLAVILATINIAVSQRVKTPGVRVGVG